MLLCCGVNFRAMDLVVASSSSSNNFKLTIGEQCVLTLELAVPSVMYSNFYCNHGSEFHALAAATAKFFFRLDHCRFVSISLIIMHAVHTCKYT